jgi:hypothetical protein
VSHTDPSTCLTVTAGIVFHRTLINKVVLLIFATAVSALVWLSFDQGQKGSGLFFAGVVGLLLVAVTRDPSQLEIMHDSIVIKYPVWQRTIAFSDIKSITLTDVSVRANVWAAVIIETKRSQSIRLFRFREGSLALNEALQATLKRSTTKG